MNLCKTSIRLGLPYNHDSNYASWLSTRLESVCEIYFPLHISMAISAHSWDGPEDPQQYENELKHLAAVLNPAGIDANLIINYFVDPVRWPEIASELEKLNNIFDKFVVSLCSYDFGKWLHMKMPTLRLTVSTIAFVESGLQANQWKSAVGVESITLSREINKSFHIIRDIKSLGLKTRMVLDDVCLPNCPALMSHLERILHGEKDRCTVLDIRQEKPWLVAQKDVVPATLPLYEGLLDIAKIEGRHKSLEEIDRKRLLYLQTQSWEHPDRIYIEPEGAFEKILSCNRQCDSCGWCARHFIWEVIGGDPIIGLSHSQGNHNPELLTIMIEFSDQNFAPCFIEIRTHSQLQNYYRKGSIFAFSFRGKDTEICDHRRECLGEAIGTLVGLDDGRYSTLTSFFNFLKTWVGTEEREGWRWRIN